MALIFFDTSALVRRYDRSEPGAARVRALCRRPRGHSLYLARITPLEVASAFNRKVREGGMTPTESQQAWRLFLDQWRNQYGVFPLDDAVHERGQQLLFRHPLKAYDAVQLASALRLVNLIGAIALDFRFCTADRTLAQAARDEGLQVEFIS